MLMYSDQYDNQECWQEHFIFSTDVLVDEELLLDCGNQHFYVHCWASSLHAECKYPVPGSQAMFFVCENKNKFKTCKTKARLRTNPINQNYL